MSLHFGTSALVLLPWGLLVGAGLTLFFERKVIALAQKRLGASFLGRHGWAHLPADVVKFWAKGAPRFASRGSLGALGALGALLAWTLLAAAFVLSNDAAQFEPWDFQLIAYVAFAAVGSLIASALVASSRSKYSLIAAARNATLGALAELAFLSALLLVYARCGAATFEAAASAEVAHAVSSPALGLVLLAYALFEARRPPMDHTEAESELVAGHLVEFGGRSLLAFFICEYAHVYFCIFAILVLCCGGLWSSVHLCAFVA